MDTMTPPRLAQLHLDETLSNLAGAFDGDVESVHRARIAIRRLREVLPLIDARGLDQVTKNVRAAGQHLGRVRELDVMSSLLDSMGDRFPTAVATELMDVRKLVRRRLRDARRAMVKELERLELWELRDVVSAAVPSGLRRWVPRAAAASARWQERLWTRVLERSNEAVAAAQRTPAIYFPNRSHRLRIAVKKLRYAIEVATDTGLWRPPNVLKDLRKMQGTLGTIHDLQGLNELFVEPVPERAASNGNAVICELLDAEIQRHVAEYSRRRDRISQIADACRRAATHSRWRIPAPLVAASIFTAPLLLESLVRSRPSLRPAHAPRRRHKPVTSPLQTVG